MLRLPRQLTPKAITRVQSRGAVRAGVHLPRTRGASFGASGPFSRSPALRRSRARAQAACHRVPSRGSRGPCPAWSLLAGQGPSRSVAGRPGGTGGRASARRVAGCVARGRGVPGRGRSGPVGAWSTGGHQVGARCRCAIRGAGRGLRAARGRHSCPGPRPARATAACRESAPNSGGHPMDAAEGPGGGARGPAPCRRRRNQARPGPTLPAGGRPPSRSARGASLCLRLRKHFGRFQRRDSSGHVFCSEVDPKARMWSSEIPAS